MYETTILVVPASIYWIFVVPYRWLE